MQSVITALLIFTDAELALARVFVLAKWRERACERGEIKPVDLSRSCKYGTLFMRTVFGGVIAGNYQHQFNIIDRRTIDLSDASADVLAMARPYQHDDELFGIPEYISSMESCQQRVDGWVAAYLLLKRD
jgi:hypothetical protein